MKIKNMYARTYGHPVDVLYMEVPNKIMKEWDEGNSIYLNTWGADCPVEDEYFIDETHLFVMKEGLEDLGFTYFKDEDEYFDEDNEMFYYSMRSLILSYSNKDFIIMDTKIFDNTTGVLCCSLD